MLKHCRPDILARGHLSLLHRHYIIRRDINTKLYIVHYGYVVEVIVKNCDNTSKTELDRAGQKCVKQRYID